MENPIRIVRELKGAPLSIVMVLLMVHQRVTQEFLERATGYTDKPVSQSLSYLQDVGLVNHTSSGWQLTRSDIFQGLLPLHIEEVHEESRNNSDSVVVVDHNNLTTTTTDLTNLTPPDEKFPTLEISKQILSAASHLFGQAILGDPADYQGPDLLIAWIAYAFKNHGSDTGKVKSPAGLVFWAFHQSPMPKPDKKFIDYPERFLPEEFQRTCGYWIYKEEGVKENGLE